MSIGNKAYLKWYEECFFADNVASEVLNCEEAREDLTKKEIEDLLKEFGDDEYVTVNDDKTISVLPEEEQNIKAKHDRVEKAKYMATHQLQIHGVTEE